MLLLLLLLVVTGQDFSGCLIGEQQRVGSNGCWRIAAAAAAAAA
jgi:hypothetical protein